MSSFEMPRIRSDFGSDHAVLVRSATRQSPTDRETVRTKERHAIHRPTLRRFLSRRARTGKIHDGFLREHWSLILCGQWRLINSLAPAVRTIAHQWKGPEAALRETRRLSDPFLCFVAHPLAAVTHVFGQALEPLSTRVRRDSVAAHQFPRASGQDYRPPVERTGGGTTQDPSSVRSVSLLRRASIGRVVIRARLRPGVESR